MAVVAGMERHGIKVDREKLAGLSQQFAEAIAALEGEIHTLAGAPFTIGSPKQLGEILVDSGMITQEQLQAALEEHKRSGQRLGQVLVRLNMATERQIAKTLAHQLGFTYVNLVDNPPDAVAVAVRAVVRAVVAADLMAARRAPRQPPRARVTRRRPADSTERTIEDRRFLP